MIKRVTFALAGSLLVGSAIAHVPPGTSEDYQIMEPYAGKITKLMRPDTGTSCCGITTDCRPTDIKMDGAKVQVFIRGKQADGSGWDQGPNKYLEVPESIIIHKSDIPVPIACWASFHKENNGFYCLTLGNSG